MDDGHRDPETVGYEWAAWWALKGDEPLDRVAAAARDLDQRLGLLNAGMLSAKDGAKATAAARVFMIAIAELLDPNGTSKFKATIGRRRRGKPHNHHQAALDGHRAAGIVRHLVSDGWKTEAAVEQAISATGLSRAEVFAWYSLDRQTLQKLEEGLSEELK